MRKIIVATVALIFSFVSNSAIAAADTSGIIHSTDGIAGEWPSDKFTTDKESSIQYAIDHDAQNLYIVLKTVDKAEQSKILQMGMRLFIDLKGKHKQNLGVEFPIKQEINPGAESFSIIDTLGYTMKLFGFADKENAEQVTNEKGNINLAFAWDNTEAMIIEYLIPLSMLEKEIILLDHRLISIGWKINGVDAPVVSSAPKSNSLGGLPNNGVSKPGQFSKTAKTSAEAEIMMKEQDIWTKYTINF